MPKTPTIAVLGSNHGERSKESSLALPSRSLEPLEQKYSTYSLRRVKAVANDAEQYGRVTVEGQEDDTDCALA